MDRCIEAHIGCRESYEGTGGWSDGRLGQVYDLLDAIRGKMPPGSTELGCLAEAMKSIELADQYIEKRLRENA